MIVTRGEGGRKHLLQGLFAPIPGCVDGASRNSASTPRCRIAPGDAFIGLTGTTLPVLWRVAPLSSAGKSGPDASGCEASRDRATGRGEQGMAAKTARQWWRWSSAGPDKDPPAFATPEERRRGVVQMDFFQPPPPRAGEAIPLRARPGQGKQPAGKTPTAGFVSPSQGADTGRQAGDDIGRLQKRDDRSRSWLALKRSSFPGGGMAGLTQRQGRSVRGAALKERAPAAIPFKNVNPCGGSTRARRRQADFHNADDADDRPVNKYPQAGKRNIPPYPPCCS